MTVGIEILNSAVALKNEQNLAVGALKYLRVLQNLLGIQNKFQYSLIAFRMPFQKPS